MDCSGKIQSLQGLRGAMAWWVVAGHLSKTFGWNMTLIERNDLAVDVFILLSGFVIALLIDRKREGFAPFITRRAFRVFPLYLVALLVSAALLPVQLAAWQAIDATPMNAERIALATSGLANFSSELAWHLTLAQGLLPSPSPFTLLGQAWSVSLEWQFYMFAPLAYLGLTNRRYTVPFVMTASALVFVSPAFSDAFLGARLSLFLVGMTSYLALTNRSWTWIASLLGVFILLRDSIWLAIPLTIWAAVLMAAIADLWPARLLAGRVAVYLGEISYSTYLLHMIPLFGSIYLLSACGVKGPVLQIGVAAFTIIGTLAGSVIGYRFIEFPALRFGSRLSVRTKGEAASQAS